jgi:hypothetical protein
LATGGDDGQHGTGTGEVVGRQVVVPPGGDPVDGGAVGRLLRNGCQEVGDFLGGSIRNLWERHPLGRQLEWWHAAGLHRVEVRRLSLGAAVVIWGRKSQI